ncbi:MAG: type II toxin-antitoxin system HicA family toxin [Candidatus Thermoplasmatota archaeon]|nr:addiction module toxin, HicA family [Euryarchaeota archaeon]MBU4071981.1 type II toxin-antitoxin system HicA family toxin [Candidatus Thermoplasmatota archaeon]MBU4145249.1 type II toxin-antitoxin system HicA family toxin [Candidatus Thermoplasmatota archaeon]MBU4591216.1 type II toxin-antitoxin system HicA family toxin [Candidatus Thermoplasmatota archaeon]
MSKLPILSGTEFVKALCKLGYYVRDQKGSHIHLRHVTKRPLTIPNHKEIARGTLRAILKDADITADDFLKLI